MYTTAKFEASKISISFTIKIENSSQKAFPFKINFRRCIVLLFSGETQIGISVNFQILLVLGSHA